VDSKVLGVVEEQIAVQFTGKVNILATFNRQFLGHILFKNGEIIQVLFGPHAGLKAFYRLLIQEHALQSFDYIVEPELVEERQRQIHYPYTVLKNKIAGIMKAYQDSLKLKPPENVKILIDAAFIASSLPVSTEEFEVLITLTEWNNPYDIYQHCYLMDHEITVALVSLRKKGALRILAPRR
jgi:hypothetical protein